MRVFQQDLPLPQDLRVVSLNVWRHLAAVLCLEGYGVLLCLWFRLFRLLPCALLLASSTAFLGALEDPPQLRIQREEEDVMVFNNTKVIPARLYGNKEKTGAKIEVFLMRELSKESRLWDVLVDPARKIRIGNKLYFGENDELIAEVIDNTTSRGRTLRFLHDAPYDEFKKQIEILGATPLPKYIDREPTKEDEEKFIN